MKVNSNIQAMIASNILKSNEGKFASASQKMSSGFKINTVGDDPAGMAISNRMRAQLASLSKANQNSSNAINVIQTAEGAIAEMQTMVQRIKELSIQSANGTNTSDDRKAIHTEVEALSKEIDRIAGQTEYNTQQLLNGDQDYKGYSDTEGVKVLTYNELFETNKSYSISLTKNSAGNVEADFQPAGYSATVDEERHRVTISNKEGEELIIGYDDSKVGTGLTAKLEINGVGGMKIQVGSKEGHSITVAIPNLDLESLGLNNIDLRTEEGAKKAMAFADDALAYTSKIRSRLGAFQNRFEATVSNLNVTEENLTSSFSNIRDVNMAEEMVEYTKLQILTQAGTSMLAQANEQPQQALQLLQS